MASCEIVDRNKVPFPVMANFDTGKMDQAEIAKFAIAYARNFNKNPLLISWICKKEGTCGPQNVCHEDGSFWIDYAIGRGADLSVVVNDWDYVFVFKKN